MGVLVKFYFKGGDPFYVFQGSRSITEKMFTNFSSTLGILFSSASDIQANNLHVYFDYVYAIIVRESSLLVVKFGGLVGILGINSFLVGSLIFGIIGFIGNWYFYKTFSAFFPKLRSKAAIACLYIPSNILYSSGYFKETVGIFLLGIIFYHSMIPYNFRKNINKRLLIIIPCSYLLFLLKPYIIVIYSLGFILYCVVRKRKKIKSKYLRKISTPVFSLLAIGLAVIFYLQFSYLYPQYQVSNIAIQAKFLNSNYSSLDPTSTKTFDLGEFDGTVTDILKKSPVAVFSVLFRPLPWEMYNLLSLGLSVENSLLLFFFILTLLKIKIKNLFSIPLDYPIIAMSIFMTLSLAYIIGITTSNFGTLVRYRIPLIPFFVMTLFVYSSFRKNRKN